MAKCFHQFIDVSYFESINRKIWELQSKNQDSLKLHHLRGIFSDITIGWKITEKPRFFSIFLKKILQFRRIIPENMENTID